MKKSEINLLKESTQKECETNENFNQSNYNELTENIVLMKLQ